MGRIKAQDEIDEIINEWMSRRTTAEVLRDLDSVGVPAGEVNTIEELCRDYIIHERNIVMKVQDEEVGELFLMGPAIKMQGARKLHSAPPALGQHNHEVFADLLTFSEQEITKLSSDGII